MEASQSNPWEGIWSEPQRFAVSILVLGLLISTALAGAAWADATANDRFTHLGATEGLESRVLDIAQDRQGFLWLATQTGLRQYDGIRVKTHLHNPNDPSSISDSHAQRLLVGSEGTLWIATNNGRLDRWIPKDERFVAFDLELGGVPTDLDELAPGRFLVGTDWEAVSLVSVQEGTVEPRPGLNRVECMAVDPKTESVWGFRLDALVRFAIDDLAEEQSFPWPSAYPVPSALFLDCMLTEDGSVWAATYLGGAVRFQPATGELSIFQHDPDDPSTLTGNDSTAVLQDSRGNIWIAGFSGLNRLEPETSTFRRYTSNPINRRGLANDQVTSIFEDQTGQLWLGTDFGAARFDPFRESFSFYSYDPTRNISPPIGSIRSFAEDEQGRLWVGSRSNGIARLDRTGDETIFFTAGTGPDDLPDDTAWALSYEAPDRLWVGTERGLSRLQISEGTWQSLSTPGGEPFDRIVTLFRDRSGSLWAGGDAGLFRHLPGTDTLELIELDQGKRILAMTDDSKGRLFVGTEGSGLVVLDAEDGERLKHWPSEQFALDRPSEGVVTTLVTIPGESETIWAGSLGGGLFRLEADDTWSRFGRDQGLPSNTIRTLLAEPDGTLWLSTGIETVHFDPQTGSLESFQPADGLPSVIHTKAAFQNPYGEFFFGGLDGFVSFFPHLVRIDNTPPRIVLTDLRIGDRSVLPRRRQPESPLRQSISLAKEITLRHYQNDFSIELAALHFGDPSRNRYAYRLEGVDTGWIHTSAERSFARYSGIPAGRHVFRAKAASRDGIWSKEEARLEIHVMPPPWRSWWAWTLYALAGLSLVIWWIHTETSRLKLEKELQEKELKVLRGMLPICSTCRKIRDDEGQWESLEMYLDTHSDAKLTHGICPECSEKILAELREET